MVIPLSRQKAKKSGINNFFKKRGENSKEGSEGKEIIDIEAKKSRKKKKKEKTLKKTKDQGKLSFGKVGGAGFSAAKDEEGSSTKVDKLSLIVLEEVRRGT